ncbi:MAG: Zn-ribbon domain-containing OB-fold protein [Desulfurococcales archaeon]|nr:Zn-ribbon domain-containing OB-fold protein [Desulfurococcales archaeon]
MKYSIARYWRERHSHYRLKAVRCLDCNRVNYPPSTICRYCGSKNLEEIELFEQARLLTWSVIHAATEGFEDYKPIIIAIVELVDSKVKILTQLTDIDLDEIKPGMLLEPVLRRVSEDDATGIIQYAIKYRPVLKRGD